MADQLNQALAQYRASLPEGRTEIFRIDGADYLGIPIYNIDLFTETGHYNGIGYGATVTEALVGAYGELAEECHRQLSFPDLEQRSATYAELLNEVGPDGVIDPVTLVLPAGSTYTPDLTLRWVTVERLSDGQSSWCPAEFVCSGDHELPDYPNQLTTAITNGNGAGDTEDRAVLHGLLELLQRDGNADCFRALDRGIVIDPATVDDAVSELIEEMAGKHFNVTMKLARVTCGCSSVYAVGDDVSDDDFGLSATACGEAADPSIQKALRKAVLECASSHSRKRFNNLPFDRMAEYSPEGYFERIRKSVVLDEQEKRALSAMVDLVTSPKSSVRELLSNTVYREETTVSAADLPDFTDDGVSERLAYVLKELALEDLVVYVFRSASTGGKSHAVKVIVPGIEMEFGSYHRIGYRGVMRLLEDDPFNLLYRNGAPGRTLIRLTPDKDKELAGPFYLDTAELDRLIDPLYALYREPTAHAAPIAIEEDYLGGSTEK